MTSQSSNLSLTTTEPTNDLHARTDEEKCQILFKGKPLIFPPLSPDSAHSPEELKINGLKASCIEALADKDGCISVSIELKHAIIEGPLNLKYITFKGEVTFINCEFSDTVDFSFATFQRSVSFVDNSVFKKRVDFRAAHAMRDFRVSYSQFKDDCCFMDFRADEVFRAEGTHFNTASFEQAVFAKRVFFCPKNPEEKNDTAKQVQFDGDVTFMDAHIQGAAHFEGAAFNGAADFRRTQIESSVHFGCFIDRPGESGQAAFIRTCFVGDAKFNGARIQGTAYFRGVHFHGNADFERAWIGGHALFIQRNKHNSSVPACFMKEARFLSAYVGGNAEFDGACFEEEAIFERIEVNRNAFFRSFYDPNGTLIKTEFKGKASFLGSRIKGDAEFRGTKFTGVHVTQKTKKADFEGFQVEGTAFFNDKFDGLPVGNVCFNIPVEFMNAHFHQQAKFPHACFKKGVDFTNLTVDGSAEFECAKFHEETKFISAYFKNQISLKNAEFNGKLDFTDLKVDGAAFFDEAKFLNTETKFHASRFKTLYLKGAVFNPRKFEKRWSDSIWEKSLPYYKKRLWHQIKSNGNIDMSGTTYDYIQVDLDNILLCLDPYDRQPYTQLEKSYRSVGQDREADIVYYDGSCRAGQQLWSTVCREGDFATLSKRRARRELPRAFFNGFQRKVFRYGVRPYRLLLISFGMLLLGMLVFVNAGSIVHKDVRERALHPEPHVTTWGEAFNMSLRQFIPVVEIPPGADWVPSDRLAPLLGKAHISFAGYATMQRIFGFILIPLGVASLTGLLRRRDKPNK
jgi:pentapeptide repeat protein